MFLRRIYMLFPRYADADRAVTDLVRIGVDRRHIHSIAKEGVDITGLPRATLRQRSDLGARLDRWFWDLNLLLFFLALVLFALAAFSANWPWAIVWLAVLALSYFLGSHFARHVPHAHMTQAQTALRHGEVLLLVDVPRWRVARVEKAIRQQHSEVGIGGVGSTLDALGI